MGLHSVNDRFKVKVDDAGFFSGSDDKKGVETGVVVEVPDMLIYLSFHNFAFEDSLLYTEKLQAVLDYYAKFKGKRIYWESYQDRGRMLTDSTGDYVFLQMTDMLAYSDEVDEKAENVADSREGGFKV